MINLIYLDNYSINGDNGINTYTYEILKGLKNKLFIKPTCLWLNSNKEEIYNEYIDGIQFIHYPQLLIKGANPSAFFDSLIEILLPLIIDNENNVIHLNWIG